MSTALGDLLGSLSVETFFRDHYPGRLLALHGSLDRLPDFFRSELLLDPSALSRAYRGPIYVTNRNQGRYQVHGPEARAFVELGLSVGFTKMEELLPGAPEWLRSLEAELGVPRGMTTMAAFVNAAGSGLSVHCDVNEQIAIHVRGPKSFRVAPHPVPFPRMQHVPGQTTPPEWLAQAPTGLASSTTLPEEAERIDLRPGSILYTPRGLYHETLAGDEMAVTCVVAFRNPTPAELLARYLERMLLQSDEWRRPLDFAWSAEPERGEAARARMMKLLAELAPRLQTLSEAHLFASAEAPQSDAKKLAPWMRFQRDASTRVEMTSSADGKLTLQVALALGTGSAKRITLPGALRPAVAWLVEGVAPFTFEQTCERFSEWEPSALAAVVAYLLRTKALVELPFEAW